MAAVPGWVGRGAGVEVGGSGGSAGGPGRVQQPHEGLRCDPCPPCSNSVKKSQPALPISKIGERLEQYTQAVEVRQGPPFHWVLLHSCSHSYMQPAPLHPADTPPSNQRPSNRPTPLPRAAPRARPAHSHPRSAAGPPMQREGGRAAVGAPRHPCPTEHGVSRGHRRAEGTPFRGVLLPPCIGTAPLGKYRDTKGIVCVGGRRGSHGAPHESSPGLSPLQTAGRTPKLTRQPSIELPSMAVASTKTLWEMGEVQAQSAAKGASCKVGPLLGKAAPPREAGTRPSRRAGTDGPQGAWGSRVQPAGLGSGGPCRAGWSVR